MTIKTTQREIGISVAFTSCEQRCLSDARVEERMHLSYAVKTYSRTAERNCELMIRKCFCALNLSCLEHTLAPTRMHAYVDTHTHTGECTVIDEGAFQEYIRTLRH